MPSVLSCVRACCAALAPCCACHAPAALPDGIQIRDHAVRAPGEAGLELHAGPDCGGAGADHLTAKLILSLPSSRVRAAPHTRRRSAA